MNYSGEVIGAMVNGCRLQLRYELISQNRFTSTSTLKLSLYVYKSTSGRIFNMESHSAYYILQGQKVYSGFDLNGVGLFLLASKTIEVSHLSGEDLALMISASWFPNLPTFNNSTLIVQGYITLPAMKPIINATKITIMEKGNDGYESFYPKNHALNVDRLTKNISYIDGEDLLTTLQNTANMFIAPTGENFYQSSLTNLNNSSYMCGVDNFIAVFTPYNPNADHYMFMQVSYDGGKTWQTGSYYNSNVDTQINIILGAEAVKIKEGGFEVLVVGQSDASSIVANSYKILFMPFSNTVPYSVNMFSGNKIPLTV